MKNIIESQSTKKISAALSVITALITLLQFYNPQINMQTMTTMTIVAIAVAIVAGIGVYLIIFGITVIVKRIIKENITEVEKKLEDLNAEKELLKEKILLRDVINLERLGKLYPAYHGQHGTVIDKAQVQAEMHRVRENFRVNKSQYEISLDFVDEELNLLYGAFLKAV